MNTEQFKEIERLYHSEQLRWQKLKVGQIVYVQKCVGVGEVEHYIHLITDVEVDNRKLHVLDYSISTEPNGVAKTIEHFKTIPELEREGIHPLIDDEKIINKSKELIEEYKEKEKLQSIESIEDKEFIENFVNWVEVSRLLANNETSISRNRCPKKYRGKVNELLLLINTWAVSYDKENSDSE